jgi:hypothetical protein
MSSNLTTKEKVKTYLSLSGTTNDALLDELIKNITSQIEIFCNRNFTEASYTEYFDTECGEDEVFLRNLPASTLTSVQYRGGTWGAITWFDFNINDYLLNSETGALEFASSLPDADKYLKVVYTGGYKIDFNNETSVTLHTLPFDLTQIATEMVAQLFTQRKSAGILSESTEGQSITYKDNQGDLTKNSAYTSRIARYKVYNL